MQALKIREIRKKLSMVVFIAVVFLLGVVPLIEAQELSDTTKAEIKKLFDTGGKFRLEASFFGGGGSKKFEPFTTTENKIVTLSPGGGFGGKLSAGYCLNSLVNVNFEIGTQTSTLSQKLSNADGSFTRTFLIGTLRYKIPVTTLSSMNICGGAGIYMGGKRDVDGSQIEGGGHNIYEYDNSIGIHIMAEYEHFLSSFSAFSAKWSWSIGLKYYNIIYKLNSATSNDISIPTQYVTDEFSELNGSGFDVIFSIAMYY